MDIQKLQALAVIQEAGSFSRAAETLGYSQAGLTYMMNSLENEVGLRLLDRSYSGVRLSETGKALMPKIHRLLQVYDSLNGEIRACKRSQESTLRLAALDTISTRWVPRAVAQLKEEYPHITVSVISGSPMQVDNWLRDGSVEIGVTDRRWTGAELDWTKLVDDPFLAVLPPDSDAPDPMPADYLSGKAVIIPDYGTNTDTTRVFTRAGVEPAYTDDRLNNRSVLAAVAAGLGSTVFSRLELDYYAQQNLTVRAIDPPCLRELGVAMRPAVKNNPVARSLSARPPPRRSRRHCLTAPPARGAALFLGVCTCRADPCVPPPGTHFSAGHALRPTGRYVEPRVGDDVPDVPP